MKKNKTTTTTTEVVPVNGEVVDKLATHGLVIDVAIGERVEQLNVALTNLKLKRESLWTEQNKLSGAATKSLTEAMTKRAEKLFKESELVKEFGITPDVSISINIPDQGETPYFNLTFSKIKADRGMRGWVVHPAYLEAGWDGQRCIPIPKKFWDACPEAVKFTQVCAERIRAREEYEALEKELVKVKKMRGTLDVKFKSKILEASPDTAKLLDEARAALPAFEKEIRKLLSA